MSIEEMKARLDKLRGTSLRLSADRKEETQIAAEIVAEEERIDKEGREAVREIALLRQAEAIAALPESERAHTITEAVIDWPTHKRTMRPGDIESGRGIIVVRALDKRAAAQALKTRGKAADGGVALYDASPENVNSGLMSAVLYPSKDVLQEMLIDCEALCKSAYVQAVGLAGGFAHPVSGKSDG